MSKTTKGFWGTLPAKVVGECACLFAHISVENIQAGKKLCLGKTGDENENCEAQVG